MKKTFLIKSSLAALSFLAISFSRAEVDARDLTYKFGVGYKQAYTGAYVRDNGGGTTAEQVHGLQASFGIARDLQLGAFFGFLSDFNLLLVGPSVRYELQRLISRDAAVWNYLHLYAEAAFLGKFGKEAKAGVTLHAPYIGFEILPFSENHFAIHTGAGLVLDFGGNTEVSFTQGLLGDLGVKYYF